jgi:hypothetical protein
MHLKCFKTRMLGTNRQFYGSINGRPSVWFSDSEVYRVVTAHSCAVAQMEAERTSMRGKLQDKCQGDEWATFKWTPDSQSMLLLSMAMTLLMQCPKVIYVT